MSGEFPRGFVETWEDFEKDNVTNFTETVASSATQDVSSKHGGWWVQTLAGDDADALLLAGERCYEVDEGHPLIFETRLYVTDADKASVFVGFTDDNAESVAVVIEDEDGTLNTVATDAFGFMLEGEQDATWQVMGVQTDVDNTQAALTSAADAGDSVIQTLRLEANPNSSGTVYHFIDGKLCTTNGTKTSWFGSGIVFCVALSSDDRATAYTACYDYIYACAPRS